MAAPRRIISAFHLSYSQNTSSTAASINACATWSDAGAFADPTAPAALQRRREMLHQNIACQLGISKSTLHRIEMGEQSVGLDRLEQLRTRLHCEIGELFPSADTG